VTPSATSALAMSEFSPQWREPQAGKYHQFLWTASQPIQLCDKGAVRSGANSETGGASFRMEEAGFTSSSGGVRAPSVTRTRNMAV
jgi:hypothetical protein